MKTRFTTLDVCAAISEIQEKLIGLRVANVYDVDNKTYLFKLAKPDVKAMLLVESGLRIHLTDFEWQKNTMPSSFSIKMRKHLRGRRLVQAKQLGIDRIVDLQFGSDEAAYHVIIELYDRGNIALTDHNYVILNLLRYRKDNVDSDVRIAAHEPYPIHNVQQKKEFLTKDGLVEILKNAKPNDLLKRVLNPHLPYGSSCIEHCLILADFSLTEKVTDDMSSNEEFVSKLHSALKVGESILNDILSSKSCKGFLIQKQDKKADGEVVLTNKEYHPVLFAQHKQQLFVETLSFNSAIDEFYGKLESQKADMKVVQQEKNALKTLNNFKKDHTQRLSQLEKEQENDKIIAKLIEDNLTTVDQAIKIIRSAIANQIDWEEIDNLVKDAQARGDSVANAICRLKLETNHIVMLLNEPEDDLSEEDDEFEPSSGEGEIESAKKKSKKPTKVEIDLGMSAYANAKMFYDKKRQAAYKQKKTVEASEKAFKSAEKKTMQALKDVAAVQNIQKARKRFWFEKFLWFVTSENYLVLGGRDAQQNEILVRRYLKPGDVYVHADVHGATSCVVKNPHGLKQPVPPKTLNEAGSMAICHSAAWEAKVVISAWWVNNDQVSKTAPSGEYLSTGSFLIRGKKNYLPPSFLVYGFGLLFKVDETCIWRHKGERKIRAIGEDNESIATSSDLNPVESIVSSDSESENESETGDDIGESADFKLEKTDMQKEEINFENIVEVQSDDICTNTTAKNVKDDFKTMDSEIMSDIAQKTSKIEMISEFEFPNTNIKVALAPVDDKYQLEDDSDEEQEDGEDVVHLGDENPVTLNQGPAKTSKPRMSAKQRRDLKKKNKQDENAENFIAESPADDSVSVKSERSTQSVQEPLKRGQRKKLQKMKTKYRDQDEEERRMNMELLQQSSEFKQQGKKAKKQEKLRMKQQQQEKRHELMKERENKAKQQKSAPAHLKTTPAEELDSDEEREMILQEEHLLHESQNILDSLTGRPHPDDALLFAVPICAPYNVMQNYKFRVKLTPGNTKKGKAAKTALSLFQSMRDITTVERSHLRSIKDDDLNRYMPGKVKVSAPHIQMNKKKK